MTGQELRRVRGNIQQATLAAAFDPPVNPSRISQIEAYLRVPPKAATKYLAALAKAER